MQCLVLIMCEKAVTSTQNGMERNPSLFSRCFRKNSNLGLGIPKLRFLESKGGYSMDSGRKILGNNGTEYFVSFWVLVTTCVNGSWYTSKFACMIL